MVTRNNSTPQKPVSRKIPHIPCTVILYLLNSKILLSPAENKYQSEFAVRISLFSCTKNNTFYDFRVINMRSFYEDQSFILRNVFTLSQQAAKKSQHQERQNYILRNLIVTFLPVNIQCKYSWCENFEFLLT